MLTPRCFFLRTQAGADSVFVTRIDVGVDGRRRIVVTTYERGKRCGEPIELEPKKSRRLMQLVDEALRTLDAQDGKPAN